MPANAEIIGRVAVKVLPDTGDFRKDAQRKLDAIEKQLELAVPTKIDLTGAQREMLEGIRKLNAENRANDNRKVKLYTTFGTSNLREELNKVVRKYNAMATSANKVKLDTELQASDVKLNLDQDSADHVKKQIEHWRDKISPVKVDVKLDWSTTSGEITSRRLEILTRPREVPIIPKINNAALTSVVTTLAALSGARVLQDNFTKLRNILQDLDRSVPIIGTIALAVLSIAAAGLSAASNLAALSSSLAMIAPAALSMPGLFGGMAIGITTMVLALKDFTTVFPDVKGRLSQLQDLVSANFWAKAQAPMREMIDRLLPQFTAGFGQAATQLGGFFGTLSAEISHAFDGEIKQMFTDLSTSITIATGSTDAIANSFKVLGSVGASYLPQLAKWFVDLADRFSNWLTAVAADGRLKMWIDQGIVLLGQLGQALASIGTIFSGIGKAALGAGGSSLFGFAAGLKAVSDIINSRGFQENLVGVFGAAHEAIGQITKIAGPALTQMFSALASSLQTILPMVGKTVGMLGNALASVIADPAFQQGLKDMFGGLMQGVAALAPAISQLGPTFASLMSIIALGLKQVGPLLAAGLGAIAPILDAILPALEPLVSVLSGALTQALVALTPMFKTIATAVAGFVAPLAGALQPALQALMPVFSQIGDLIGQVALAILPALGQALAELLPALVPLISALLNLILAVLKPLLPMLAELIAKYLPKIAEALVAAANAITPFINALNAVVNFIMPILMPALQFLADMLLSTIVMAINGVKDVFNGVLQIVMGTWHTFAALFTGDWSGVWNGIKEIFSGVWDLIVGIVELIFSVTILKPIKAGFTAIKALFTGEGAALSALWSSIWNAIRAFVEGIWNGIRTGFALFCQAIAHEPEAALGILKAIFADAWNAVRAIFSSAWSALKSTVGNGISQVLDLVRELPGRAANVLGNLGSVLWDAGASLIRGFIDGISSMFGAVKDKLGSLTRKLVDWKGPAPVDAVLLYDAGKLVINGFIDGLESRYDAVRKSLSGLTDDVANHEFGSPVVSLSGRMSALAGAAYDSSSAGPSKTLNYYAAPGSSLGSEEDLFAAAGRSRFGW